MVIIVPILFQSDARTHETELRETGRVRRVHSAVPSGGVEGSRQDCQKCVRCQARYFEHDPRRRSEEQEYPGSRRYARIRLPHPLDPGKK